jgi:hypothetical protein
VRSVCALMEIIVSGKLVGALHADGLTNRRADMMAKKGAPV